MEHFCVGMQAYSPVDAHVHPIPGDMPGYEDKIIMAGGTFVQGSSIELSADGPVRPLHIQSSCKVVLYLNILCSAF